MTADEHLVVVELSRKDGRALFDRHARETFGMSGDEWLRRFDAGEFDIDGDDHCKLVSQMMLIPFARGMATPARLRRELSRVPVPPPNPLLAATVDDIVR